MNRLTTALPAIAATFLLTACAHQPLQTATDEALAAAVGGLDFSGTDILIAVGDIARCRTIEGAAATARLASAVLRRFPAARIITLGDHTYPRGAADEFAECYEPTWGVHNARTAPSPGNHEYRTEDGAPYYAYFEHYAREPAARERGYYGFDLGRWRIVSLNSNLPMDPDSKQVQWLEADLRAAGRACVLAYWHHPLFSSGFHGRQRGDAGRDAAPLWDTLAAHGGDVVVNGHTHVYERFAPQTSRGEPAPDGITQLVAGTGGASHDRALAPLPTSVYVNDDTFGVLVIALGESSFEWRFVGVDGVVYDRSDNPVPCAF